MTTTTETTVTCGCRALIVPAGDGGPDWRAVNGERPGDFWCPDGSLHRPACPPSAVHDMIVPWDEVREGDLIVWDGEFHLVSRKLDYCGEPLMWFDGSKAGAGVLPCGTYAAVRRYDTDEETPDD